MIYILHLICYGESLLCFGWARSFPFLFSSKCFMAKTIESKFCLDVGSITFKIFCSLSSSIPWLFSSRFRSFCVDIIERFSSSFEFAYIGNSNFCRFARDFLSSNCWQSQFATSRFRDVFCCKSLVLSCSRLKIYSAVWWRRVAYYYK